VGRKPHPFWFKREVSQLFQKGGFVKDKNGTELRVHDRVVVVAPSGVAALFNGTRGSVHGSPSSGMIWVNLDDERTNPFLFKEQELMKSSEE
jgi:hypothetical protein